MHDAVLGALARNRPHRQIGVEFGPHHAGDLFAPLAGQDQDLDEGAETGPSRSAACQTNASSESVKHAIARDFLGRRFDAIERRGLEQAALDRPVEHLAPGGEHPVGRDRRAAIGDRIQESDDVALVDAGDRTLAPGLDDIAGDQPLGLRPGPGLL